MQLFDRAPPGEAGASFGNAGHVATELVEPLPAPGLLFGFWRELFAFGGVLKGVFHDTCASLAGGGSGTGTCAS